MTDDTKEFSRDLTDFGLDVEEDFDAAAFGNFEDSDSLGWDPESEGFILSDVGLGQWQASMIEDEVALAPERIRFATLASIRMDGREVSVDGVITNLSSEGLACVSAADLDPGMSVEISFQIDLSDEVLVIPSEIIWRRYSDASAGDSAAGDADPSYGVRFLSLSPDQERLIEDLIRERTEGRASEWSMPALPVLESAPAMTQRSRKGWVMAGAGATAALVVAMAMVLVPIEEFGMSDSSTDVPAVVVKAGSGALMAASRVVEEVMAESQPVVVAPEPVAELQPVAEPVEEPKEVQELAAVEPQAPVEPVVSEEPTRVENNAVNPSSGHAIVVGGDDDLLKLTLPTDGKVAKHRSFWLSNPQRFVVDVIGRKAELARLSYDIDHPLAQRVRVGRHPDKVRFVVDTSPEVLRKATLETFENELVVNLRRR